MTNAAVEMAKHLELWPLDRLKPYDRNPRKHSDAQVAKIAAAIIEFGFTNPILVDDKDGIIAGHGRLMAAKKLKLAEVPVIRITHLSDDQRRALVIADNKLALEAGWDLEVLKGELDDLSTAGFDLALTGFDDEDMRRIADDLDELMLRGVATGASAPSVPSPAPAHTPAHEDAEDEGDEEDGSDAEEYGDEQPTGAAGSDAGSSEYVPFSLIMRPEHRAAVYDAIRDAKQKHNLENSGDALFAIIEEWRNQQ